jgi:hypothetical protein
MPHAGNRCGPFLSLLEATAVIEAGAYVRAFSISLQGIFSMVGHALLGSA